MVKDALHVARPSGGACGSCRMAGGTWSLGCGDGRHGRVPQTLVLLPDRVLFLFDLIPGLRPCRSLGIRGRRFGHPVSATGRKRSCGAGQGR